MKESELKEKINTDVTDAVEEILGKKIKEKLESEEVKTQIDGQLKEHMSDAVKQLKEQMPPESEELKKAEDKTKEFKSGGEFLSKIRQFRVNRDTLDPRLSYLDSKGNIASAQKTAGHMEIGDDSQGGFLVPEIFKNELYEIALENSIVRPHGATVIKMTTDSVKIPYVNDTSHASTVFGGIVAYWTAEADQKTASKPTFGQMELTPHKLAGITYASNELMDDSAVALEPLIKRQFGAAWGYYEDDAFLDGTGAGQPMGIQNCNCVISPYRNTASHVYLEDLAEMYSHMLPSSHSSAYWVIHPSVIPELIQLGSGNAAAASGKNLVWINNAADGPPFRILGRPVLVSEKMEYLGTAGDIGYYDFRYYLIGDRQPITIDASPHLRFDYDETAWRFVLRVAGQCWPQAKITTKDGTHSYSPFVQLAATTS